MPLENLWAGRACGPSSSDSKRQIPLELLCSLRLRQNEFSSLSLDAAFALFH